VKRYILVGPPRAGKSTYARALRELGIPTFCTDPLSLVKDPEDGVTYLNEGLAWSDASRFVADYWMTMQSPYCIDGIATVRALRKILDDGTERARSVLNGVIIVKFDRQFEHAVTKEGQRSMAKAIETVWREIAPVLPAKVQFV
jgi:Fe-S cluster assembly ATPase SufC